MKWFLYFLPALLLIPVVPSTLVAQLDDENQVASLTASIAQLESRLSQLQADTQQHAAKIRRLDSAIEDAEKAGFSVFLFGVFCALWAQNTGRSPWRWFFLGLFFNVITVLFLLHKNAKELAHRRQTGL